MHTTVDETKQWFPVLPGSRKAQVPEATYDEMMETLVPAVREVILDLDEVQWTSEQLVREAGSMPEKALQYMFDNVFSGEVPGNEYLNDAEYAMAKPELAPAEPYGRSMFRMAMDEAHNVYEGKVYGRYQLKVLRDLYKRLLADIEEQIVAVEGW